MNTKNNLRSQETRQRIKDALVTILQRKDILDLTVSRLCQTAHINRSTFYSHYDSIGDVMEELEKEIGVNLLSRFSPDCYDADHPFSLDNLKIVLVHIRENQTFYRAYLTQSISQNRLDWTFAQLLQHIVQPMMRRRHVEDSATEYYFTFFRAGFVAIIQQWLKNDCRETPETILSYIDNILGHPYIRG